MSSAALIDVRLPDGSSKQLPADATSAVLASAIGSRLAKAAVAAVVNGHETDLSAPLASGDQVAIITADSDAGRHVLRHSTAHVMAQAVLQLFPGAKFTIGPAIEDGFYYDFELPGGRTFTDDDLASITQRMQEIVQADQPFVRSEMAPAQALALFADQPYKCEIIQRVTSGAADDGDAGEVGGGDSVSVYRNSDSFVDLCRGPHVPSTGKLGH
ncbi:MAG: TGS domain-containing protein, partial [Actinobacteria bacterium]|nr:TGS domain-containing protein [Actinomycetota bacterium]